MTLNVTFGLTAEAQTIDYVFLGFTALQFTASAPVISGSGTEVSLSYGGPGSIALLRLYGSGFTTLENGLLAPTGTITSIEILSNYYLTPGGPRGTVMTLDMTVATADVIAAAQEDDTSLNYTFQLGDLINERDWTFQGGAEDDYFTEQSLYAGNLLYLSGDDHLSMGTGNDMVYAWAGDDTVLGEAGFDTLEGGSGNDMLDGGAHADLLSGHNGNDMLVGGDGFDVLWGGNGEDTLYGGAQPDRLNGGTGNDLIYAGSSQGFAVDGSSGGTGNDTIYGESGFDVIHGGEGDDHLDGGGQADNLYGDAGNDTLFGGQGLDRLFGGAGDDLVDGGIGTDNLFGGTGGDTLLGDAGEDWLYGGTGNDQVLGGADRDNIHAGAGFDTVNGGSGNDVLYGNFNADTFVFDAGHGNDTIADFEATNDFEVIDLRGVLPGADFDDIMALSQSYGSFVVIRTTADSSILLNDVDIDDLDAADFVFDI